MFPCYGFLRKASGTILLNTTDERLTAGNIEHTHASQKTAMYMDAASAHTASIS